MLYSIITKFDECLRNKKFFSKSRKNALYSFEVLMPFVSNAPFTITARFLKIARKLIVWRILITFDFELTQLLSVAMKYLRLVLQLVSPGRRIFPN